MVDYEIGWIVGGSTGIQEPSVGIKIEKPISVPLSDPFDHGHVLVPDLWHGHSFVAGTRARGTGALCSSILFSRAAVPFGTRRFRHLRHINGQGMTMKGRQQNKRCRSQLLLVAA